MITCLDFFFRGWGGGAPSEQHVQRWVLQLRSKINSYGPSVQGGGASFKRLGLTRGLPEHTLEA